MTAKPATEENPRLDRRDVRKSARELLGHEKLLPGQAEAVQAVVAGRDTLALLPTGGGKSAIYQLAGVERSGPTLVVSPLLALQQDQLAALEEVGLSGALLNSTLAASEHAATLAAFTRGEIEFLLLAPEQLTSPELLDRVVEAHPSLLVIDEAHCISEWGHDFRPEYRRLGKLREVVGGPPVLALTGTASPPVREDIVRWLRLDDPAVIARGFDRPEIFLEVTTHVDTPRKREALLDWVASTSGPGIVYAATRRGTTEVASSLEERGIDAAAYHAGLGKHRRKEVLDGFMDGMIDVVVATIAFGMGVDKPDVRFVAHHDPSDSLDAYHQEIGRAGRDGERADAHLFFDARDLGLRRFQSVPPPLTERDVFRVLRTLQAGPTPLDSLASRARLSERRTEHVVGRLEALDGVRVGPTGEVSWSAEPGDARPDFDTLARDVVEAQERRRHLARSRVDLLRGYAETRGCRRRYLLNALGEEFEPPCGHCDNCLAGGGREEVVDGMTGTLRLSDRVVHATFGEGEVSRVEGDRVVVRFDSTGYRTLALPDVLNSGLLRRHDPKEGSPKK